MTVKQKEIFLESEGDAWFARNQLGVASRKLPDDDAVLREVLDVLSQNADSKLRVLEVGCGDGTRLAWLQNNLDADCHGIDPSAQAVAAARSKGIDAQISTADALPFEIRVLISSSLASAFTFVIVKTCFALPAKQIACCVRWVG